MTIDACKGYVAYTLHNMYFSNDDMVEIIGTFGIEVKHNYSATTLKLEDSTNITKEEAASLFEKTLVKLDFKSYAVDEILLELLKSFSLIEESYAEVYFNEDMFFHKIDPLIKRGSKSSKKGH